MDGVPPTVIYLIENQGGKPGSVALPPERLFAAAVQLSVCDGFHVKHTSGPNDTALFLANLTKDIARNLVDLHYTSKPLEKPPQNTNNAIDGSCSLKNRLTYEAFAQLSAKSAHSVGPKELFIKQLLRLRQMTPDSAVAIQSRFNTPRALYEHFQATLPSSNIATKKNWIKKHNPLYLVEADMQTAKVEFENQENIKDNSEGALGKKTAFFGPKLTGRLVQAFSALTP